MIIETKIGYWERLNKKDVQAAALTLNNVIKYDGSLVMGAGCALQYSKEFPFLARNWGMIIQGIQESGHSDFHIIMDGPHYWNKDMLYIVGVQTKRHWKDPSDPDLIVESCKRLRDLADLFHWESIICPAFGCGYGGLEWKDVEKKLSKILDDRFTVINLSEDGII